VKKGMNFEQISKAINRSEWYTAAIFYGQAKPDDNDIKALSKVMDIREEYLQEAMGPHFFPTRGLGEFPPKDPVIYRLYECIVVYGYPLKHMIHEKFGDGEYAGRLIFVEDRTDPLPSQVS
jgi:cyanate lyase